MSTCLGTILVLDRQMDRWICHNSISLCIHCMLKCDKTVKQRWNFKLGCVIPTGSVRKDLTVQYTHKRTLHNAQRNVQSSDAPDWANYYSDTQDTSLSQQFLLSILLAHQLFNYCERRVAPWSLSQTMYRQALPDTTSHKYQYYPLKTTLTLFISLNSAMKQRIWHIIYVKAINFHRLPDFWPPNSTFHYKIYHKKAVSVWCVSWV